MGCGKSTAATVVADRLGSASADSDAAFAGRIGMSAGEYLATRGEPAFRRAEAHIVAGLVAQHRRGCPDVVALGGGAVTTTAVRQTLAGHHVMYLHTTWEQVCARLTASGEAAARPLFDPVRGRARFDGRLAVYEQVASAVVDTTDLTPDQVADAVIATVPPRLTDAAPCGT